ncbi:MAG: formylglycine-generating enzyme family protein [Treponema sp.]|jgi:formylglycine-generating enzyme required for sulfatase activity|nr:formylglycine-generating enzyme family protein [Treponema sp.]
MKENRWKYTYTVWFFLVMLILMGCKEIEEDESKIQVEYIEGGTFLMGSANSGNSDEQPVHSVTVRSFYMGKYEVTQREWLEVMGSNPSYFIGEDLPVERVSWYEAVEYCNKRSLKEGLTPAYSGGGDSIVCDFSTNGYRLPTEAEWEYAAKGGNKDERPYEYSGDDNVDNVAWYADNSGFTTHPVGTKAPNSLGLYDMTGNVWEWCWDWYGSYGSDDAQTDPTGASSGSNRVRRGGSSNLEARYMHATRREKDSLFYRLRFLGFRLVHS